MINHKTPAPIPQPARRQHWLYHNGRPIFGVLLPAGTDLKTVKEYALRTLDITPGVLCDYPFEAPFEKRYQIYCSELRLH